MLHPDVQVSHSHIHGRGLIATRFIPHSTFIWQLDAWRAEFTYEELSQLPTPIQELCYFYDGIFVLVYDGSQYMNHSCDPNTGWLDDITLISIRDIQPGEEVTYDYGSTEIDLRHRGVWACHCGTTTCRGIITPYDYLAPAFQYKYRGLLPSWLLRRIEPHLAALSL